MNYKLVSLFQLVHIHSLSCVNAAATCTQRRLSRVAVKSKYCTSPLLYFTSLFTFIFPPYFSYLPSALNMEELICSFCSQHLILFIFPLVFFSSFLSIYPTPTIFFQAGLCCQALPEHWGCQEWWMTINLLLSSTTLLRDLQARWLPGMKTNLSFSFFPPFFYPCPPHFFHLALSFLTSFLLKKSNWRHVCKTTLKFVCGQKNCSPLKLLWMCQKGITHSGWYAWSLTT